MEAAATPANSLLHMPRIGHFGIIIATIGALHFINMLYFYSIIAQNVGIVNGFEAAKQKGKPILSFPV